MICVLLAVLCSSAISVVMKISDSKGQSGYAILCMNYLFASVFSLAAALRKGIRTEVTLWFWILGIATGVIFLLAFILNQRSISRNGAVLSAVFMKMGIIVPLFLSLFLWHEKPSGLQVFGIILALSAILTMTVHISGKSQSPIQSLWVLPALLVCAGTADCMSKFYTLYGIKELNEWYIFLTFFTAFLLCFPLMLCKGEHFNLEKLKLGSALGLVNYASTWFLLLSVFQLPTYLVYPMVNTGAIAVVTVIGMIVFKEKLSRRQMIGLGFVFAAVVLLNL